MITTFSVSTIETMEEIKKMGCPRLYSEIIQTRGGYEYLMVSFLHSFKDEVKNEDDWFNRTIWDRIEEPKESFKVGEGMYRYYDGFMWYLEIDGMLYYATNY